MTDTIKLIDPENPVVGADFVLKIANFRCRGNKAMPEPNVTGTFELADPENHTIEPKITTLSYIQPKLWQILW